MSDIDDMRTALEALEKQTFTPHEMGVLEGLMASWDQVDYLDDNAEALLRETFKNDFAKAGAITQVVMLAEKNSDNDVIDAQLKEMIEKSMGKWNVESAPRAKMK